ncbi:MAG: hypothetical protein IK130_01650 [Oscillospiraceae bacterium]|nr:hypothetical protein [Oscillospiraceae bacterium]
MFFAEFVQELHKYIREPKGQDSFLKKLFESALPQNLYRYIPSSSSLKRCYKGKTDDQDKVTADHNWDSAYTICKGYQPEEFAKFIKAKAEEANCVNELCSAFQDELPEITVENYPSQLAELMGKILKEAANQNERKPMTKPAPTSKQDTQEAVANTASWRMLEQDRNAIADILKKIYDKLGTMLKRLSDIPIWYQLPRDKQREIYANDQKGITELMEICKELQFYTERYPQYSDLLAVIAYAEPLNNAYAAYFYPNDREGEERFAAAYETFEKALQDCSRSIVNI